MTGLDVPHPATPHGPHGAEFRRRTYITMAQRIAKGADVEACMGAQAFQSEEVEEILSRRVPAAAEAVYQAEFLGMAVDYLPFFAWSVLQDRADKGALLRGSATACGRLARTASCT